MIDTPTIVIGAGPGGLAVAGLLRQRGRDFTMLEAGPSIAHSWRHHYDRLHLHTPKETSGLPGLPFPDATPTFPSRQQVVDYLDAYARHFRIEPRLNERVSAAERINGRWVVTTQQGQYSSNNLVVATGLSRVPYRPELPGQADYSGSISHASTYTNAKPFEGRRVLVVGFGNSGAEIALDLAERGTAVGVVARSGYNVIPRSLMKLPPGVSGAAFAWVARTVPPTWQDAMMGAVSKLAFGDLERYGIKPLPFGVITGIGHGKIPVVDTGTIAAIKDGRIKVYPTISSLTKTGATFEDGRAADFDCVLLATGYRTGLQEFLRDSRTVLNDAGVPRTIGRESELPGLYFVGYEVRLVSLLYTMMLDAHAVVDRLAA